MVQVDIQSDPPAPAREERKEGAQSGFMKSLVELVKKDDRAALARLRRTAGKEPGDAYEAFRYVAGYTDGLRPWPEQCRYLVAGLFAMHPPKRLGDDRVAPFPAGTLGAAFVRLIAPPNANRRDSVERRFTQVLAAGRDQLPDQLRQAISLLRSGDVAVNWQQLLWDMERWEDVDHRVQRGWAKEFWKLPVKEEDGANNTTDEAATDDQSE